MLEIFYTFWNIWSNIKKISLITLIFLRQFEQDFFLFKVLEGMDFEENFIKWVRSIYTTLHCYTIAEIIVNGDLRKSC